MDDTAASQQLLEEGARAGGYSQMPVGSPGGDEQEVLSLPSTPDADPVSSQKSLPSSLPSFAHKHRDEDNHPLQDEPASPPMSNASAPSTPRRIEVPDSQLAPAPASGKPAVSPLPSPEPSSFVIPASIPKAPLYKKDKKRLRAEVDATEQHASDDHEDTATGAAESSSALAPQNKRRRTKKSYATPPSTGSGSEQAGATSEQETSTMLSVPSAVEGAATTTPRLKKRKSLARKSTGQKSLSYSGDVEDGADDGELVIGRLPPVKRLKKSKPSKTTEQPTEQERDLGPSNEASEMDPMDLDAEQTPVETRSAEETGNRPLVPRRRKSMRKSAGSKAYSDQIGPDAMSHDTDFVEDKVPDNSLTKTPEGKRKKRARKSLETNQPRRRYTRKSNFNTSRAEKELNTFRDLNFDPECPSSGPFTEDQNELIRRAVRDYQQRTGLDVENLVSVIQWSDPSFDSENPKQRKDFTEEDMADFEESKAFWDEIMNSQPSLNRSRERVKVHVHAQFSNAKRGAWTIEEDEKLGQLVDEYGKSWKVIAYSMENRDPLDCLNRYKDYAQFGEGRNNGRWTAEEENLLLKALSAFIQKHEDERDAAQLSPIAEYVSAHINWGEIVEQMGKVRSRLQCRVKWDYMKAQGIEAAIIRPVYRRGRTPDPNQPVDPTPKTPKKTPKKDNAPSRPRGRPRKSEIGGDDISTKTPKKGKASWKSTGRTGEENGEEGSVPTKRRGRPRKSETGGEIADTPQHESLGTPACDNSDAEEAKEVIPRTPLQNGNAVQSVLQTPAVGLEEMRWGDKFDLVASIAEDMSISEEEDIDWHKISETLNNTWSVRVLQAALKDLLLLVEDQGRFVSTIVELASYLTEHCSEKEINQHYDPFAMEPLGEGDDTGAKGLQGKKKRKRKQVGVAKSRKRG
jgi:hypothetical protein